MTTYLKKYAKTLDFQKTLCHFLKGILFTIGEDCSVYINLQSKDLKLLSEYPEVTAAFTKLPRGVVRGVEPVYKDDRHIVVEFKSDNNIETLAERLVNEIGFKIVEITGTN